MKNLINFFFSFDKLMKLFLAIYFLRRFFTGIRLDGIAWIITPLEFISEIIIALVGLRLLCELAIALFRVADNTSSDGGTSDLADIDPLGATRKAAEEAAKRAREVTGKAVDKTKEVAGNLKEKAEERFDKADSGTDSAADQVFDKPKSAPKKTTPKKTSTTKKKSTAKKPSSKSSDKK